MEKRDKQHETDMLKVNPMRPYPSEPYIQSAWVGACIGSVIVDVVMGNAKCSRWGSKPTQCPSVNGLVFRWTIGFTHGLRVTVYNWSPPGREVLFEVTGGRHDRQRQRFYGGKKSEE